MTVSRAGAVRPSGLDAASDALERFDLAWRSGSPPRIDEFLPPATEDASSASSRKDVLEELVKIDLEYRWQSGRAGSGRPGARPLLEDYVAQFPELGPIECLPLALIGEEYRVRRRFGDRPDVAEFRTRFSGQVVALERFLGAIDSELAAEAATEGALGHSLSPDSTQHEALALVCPHCRSPIEPIPDPWPSDFHCLACGGSFAVDTLPGGPPGAVEPPLKQVGRYTLNELVGTGAFGSVWRAWDTELGRAVAVKLPRSGRLWSAGEEERFLREARSAAQLHHPGIIAIHDAGRDQGTVFIVSDLVRGQSLAQRVSRELPDFREAAELVAQVADAVDYAHRRGVVHRDLKPSNIMLDPRESAVGAQKQPEQGGSSVVERKPSSPGASRGWANLRPRVMDFGLAKRDAGEVTMTIDGQILGTPAYMSPEQIRDPHSVDGRTDVYSLGVILYQLLCGELPFRGVARMLQQQVIEDEPRPLRRLNDRIPRDLETITLRCLAKEPSSRYATAAALRDDLQRFLRHEPILARPVGPAARLWRWCRRNRSVASLLVLLALVFLCGFVGVVWQWRRAETGLKEVKRQKALADQSFREARQAVDDNLTQVSESALLKVEGMQPLRKALLESALKYYKRFLQQRGDDPSLLADSAESFTRVGNITETIGSKNEALNAYRSALPLYERLLRAKPGDIKTQARLARLQHNIGFVLAVTGDRPGALKAYQASRVLWDRLIAADPRQLQHQSDLAAVLKLIGNVQHADGDLKSARSSFLDALKIQERLARLSPHDDEFRSELAGCHNNLAVVTAQSGDLTGALEEFQRAREIRDKLVAEFPKVARYQSELAGSDSNIGRLLSSVNQNVEALVSYRRARDLRAKLVAANPAVTQYQSDLATTDNNIATLLFEAGNPKGALSSFRKVLDAQASLVAQNPTVSNFRRALGTTHNNIGAMLATIGDKAAALDAYQNALAIRTKLAAEDSSSGELRGDLAATFHNIGLLETETGQLDEAIASLNKACNALDPIVAAHPNDPDAQSRLGADRADLGVALEKKGRLDAAAGEFSKAIHHQEQALARAQKVSRYRLLLSDHLMKLASAQRQLQRPRDAIATALKRQGLWPADGNENYNVAAELALCIPLFKQQAAPAAECAKRAIDALRTAVKCGFADVDQIRKDSDLDPIRNRADFQELLKDLVFPARPFAK
jgi:serine/threonine-protein kinase